MSTSSQKKPPGNEQKPHRMGSSENHRLNWVPFPKVGYVIVPWSVQGPLAKKPQNSKLTILSPDQVTIVEPM